MDFNQQNEDDEFIDAGDVVRVIDLPENGEDLEEQDDSMDSDNDVEDEDAVSVNDMATVVFTAHKEKPHPPDEPPEVYAVHIDPKSGVLAVTGGRDDTAYIWNITTGQVAFQCRGHKNSVTCVAFSFDGMFVASADLDGLVKVWRCETTAEVWFFECGSDIMWLQWHHGAHVLLAGTQDGEVWMWKIPSGDCKTFQSHGFPSLCGKILSDGKSACVGYGDGSVKLWDLKAGKTQHTWQHSTLPVDEEEMKAEDDVDAEGGGDSAELELDREEKAMLTSPVGVVSVDCSTDNSLVMSGCADATAKIFSTGAGKLVSTFNCAVNKERDNSVEAVGFSPTSPYAATGTNCGAVEIWDLPTSVVRHSFKHVEGVCKLKWSSSTHLLYTACLDGVVRLWDSRSGSSTAECTGHSHYKGVLDFDLTKDESYLVTASEDGTARVFDLRSFTS